MVYPCVGGTIKRNADCEAIFFCLLVTLPQLLLLYSALTLILITFWSFQSLYKISVHTLLFQWQTQTLDIAIPHGPI